MLCLYKFFNLYVRYFLMFSDNKNLWKEPRCDTDFIFEHKYKAYVGLFNLLIKK